MMGQIPPVQRLAHWTLVSTDLERTKRFYTEVLGAQLPEREGPGPATASLAGTTIDFIKASDIRHPSPGDMGQHHAYLINVEDYDAWVEHLRAQDMNLRLTTHGLEGISIFFDDPDGYHIELAAYFENEDIGRQEIEKRGLTRVDA
jgi:catechol 2,3-dioxygenase-like lactoylglutathione lyase family enzyme